MIIRFQGGVQADNAPASAQQFTLWSENVRWRNGQAETIDLTTPLPDNNNDPIVIPLSGATVVTIFNTRNWVVIAFDKTLWVYDYNTRNIYSVSAPTAASFGRWWFVSTENEIIGARSAMSGRVVVLNMSAATVTTLANSPVGAMGGGIVNGVLALTGTTSVVGEHNPLTVRWSARRGDPAGGSGSGFEDWTPTDINSSGELTLDEGEGILGGGSCTFGLMVWTDSSTHVLTPRDDTIVFTPKSIASDRGLLASGTWTVLDSFVYWYDGSRTLNVYDGGSPRRIPSTMRGATTERMNDDLEDTVLISSREYEEVILHYTDYEDVRRQAVYNKAEGAWYPWRINRLSSADRQGTHPGIGITEDGTMFAQSINESISLGYLIPGDYPTPAMPPQYIEDGDGGPGPASVGSVEPFNWMIATSIITAENPLRDGPRNLNMVVAHTYAYPPNAVPLAEPDTIHALVESYDKASRDGVLITDDEQMFKVGHQGADFRGGGTGMRVALWGIDVRTHIRLGDVSLDTIQGARR